MKYHKHFENINEYTVGRTRYVLRHWQHSNEERRWNHMDVWLLLVSINYGMQKPKLVRDPSAAYGFYIPSRNEIHMSKPSIVTMLHEFRHAMQHQQKAGNWRDAEKDARGWSLSLYFKIAPRTLKRLVAEEKVLHMTVADFE